MRSGAMDDEADDDQLMVGARIARHEWRKATSLAILMNTRGLMELISPSLVTMLVIMAIITTMATTPVLRLVMPEAVVVHRASIAPQPTR